MKKILCALLCLGMLFGCSSNTNDESSNNNNEEETTKSYSEQYQDVLNKHKYYKSGTYAVGKDIKAGEYCLFDIEYGSLDNEFTVRKNEYSEGDDSLAFDCNFMNCYITLKDGDYIEFENAVLFSIDDMPGILETNTYCMFKVGKDIEEGNYIIKPTDESNYYAIYNPFGYDDRRNDLVTNDLDFTNEKKIKIKEGQYLKVENCSLEKQ